MQVVKFTRRRVGKKVAPQGVTFLCIHIRLFSHRLICLWHEADYPLTASVGSYIFKISNMYQQIFNLHTDILKALSHPKRLEIIHLLRDHSLSVGEIQGMLDLPQANLSQHLQVLRENKIVNTAKKGKHIFYQVAHPNFIKACDLIREVLRQKQCLSDLLPIGIDPICGMKLTPSTAAFTHTADGHLHYFCASGCLEKYKSQIIT